MSAEPMIGAAEQFEQIFSQYHRWVRGVFNAWLEDFATADDLAAELFAKLWQDMSERGLEVQNIEYLKAFLRQRAVWIKSRYFEQLAARREQPWQAEFIEHSDRSRIEVHAASLAPKTDETVNTRVDVRRALAALPTEQRRVIALRYLEDMDCETVAETVGVTRRTVMTRSRDALTALRDAAGAQPAPAESVPAFEQRREEMRRVYLESIQIGEPISLAELGRRFGRSTCLASQVVKDIKVERVNADEKARIELRAALAEGRFEPEAPLPATKDLAEQLRTSVASVGRALRKLAAEGLVMKLVGPQHGSAGRYYPAPVGPATGARRLSAVA